MSAPSLLVRANRALWAWAGASSPCVVQSVGLPVGAGSLWAGASVVGLPLGLVCLIRLCVGEAAGAVWPESAVGTAVGGAGGVVWSPVNAWA